MPPYDTLYMEFNVDALYETYGGKAATSIDLDDPDHDTKLGFLMDYRTIFVVAYGERSTSIMPVFYYLNERGHYEAPKMHKDIPVYQLMPDEKYKQEVVKRDKYEHSLDVKAKLGLMFGSSIWDVTPKMTLEDMVKLSAETALYYGMNVDPYQMSVPAHQGILSEMTGDIRLVYGALLWLNSLPHTIKYTNMPAGHRILRGKRVPMSAHNTVHIHMKGTVQVRNLFTRAIKNREHPRRHDVRGFWRHRHGIPQGCGHDWPATPDRDKIYKCKKCGRERWWVHDHQRGDASKGFVDKHYEVEI